MKRCVPLEEAAEIVCNQSAVCPLIFQLPPEQGRKVLEKAQDAPVYKYPADITVSEIDTGEGGTIPVYFVVPQTVSKIRSVSFYIHGAGWVFGSFHTFIRQATGSLLQVIIYTAPVCNGFGDNMHPTRQTGMKLLHRRFGLM